MVVTGAGLELSQVRDALTGPRIRAGAGVICGPAAGPHPISTTAGAANGHLSERGHPRVDPRTGRSEAVKTKAVWSWRPRMNSRPPTRSWGPQSPSQRPTVIAEVPR